MTDLTHFQDHDVHVSGRRLVRRVGDTFLMSTYLSKFDLSLIKVVRIIDGHLVGETDDVLAVMDIAEQQTERAEGQKLTQAVLAGEFQPTQQTVVV